jgi:hypothetical protein
VQENGYEREEIEDQLKQVATTDPKTLTPLGMITGVRREKSNGKETAEFYIAWLNQVERTTEEGRTEKGWEFDGTGSWHDVETVFVLRLINFIRD